MAVIQTMGLSPKEKKPVKHYSMGMKQRLGVGLALLIMVTVMAYAIADPEMMDAMEAQGAEITESDRVMSEYIQNMSQLDLMHETLGSGFLLVMTGIGMTLFVNSDFSNGFIKNICCIVPRRWDYVLSKIVLAGIYSGIITVLSVLLMLLSPVLIHMYPAPDSVENTCSDEPMPPAGTGLANIKAVAEKYHGAILTEKTGGWFSLNVSSLTF